MRIVLLPLVATGLCGLAACGAPAPAAPVVQPSPPPAPAPSALAPSSAPVAPAPVVPPPARFLRDVKQLSVGHAHACAVTADGAVVCWGDNAAGQVGVGRDGRSALGSLLRPHVVGGLPRMASVAAGGLHTCALDLEGAVYCWGSAGDPKHSGSIELKGAALGTPVRMPLPPGARVVSLANKGNQACAAYANEVRCWNTLGAIPVDATVAANIPVTTTKLAGTTALAIGHGKVCAIADGAVSCWRGSAIPTPAVRARGDAAPATKIAIGEMYACVANASGELRCWWSLIDDFWKKAPNRDVRWDKKPATRAVAVGDSPICTVDANGAVDCFLADEQGLTQEAAARSWATTKVGPHPITGVEMAVDVGLGTGRNAFGYGFGCALRSAPDADGAAVLCWGDNESGQLGTGDTRASPTAVRVAGASDPT